MEERSNTAALVIFDWAGTTVDDGCMAPVCTIERVFIKSGLRLTQDEIRGPMGLPKREHIRLLCGLVNVSAQWKEKHGRAITEADTDGLYRSFEEELLRILPDFCEPIDGVVQVTEQLRAKAIKIGSTTGYTAEMMKLVAPGAGAMGYIPDSLVTPEDVGAGRPAPFMIFENMKRLGVYPPRCVLKAGDTVADIREGVNAGVWSVGILKGSSEAGIAPGEAAALAPEEIEKRYQRARRAFEEAGADFVLRDITELPCTVDAVNTLLRQGKCPGRNAF